MMHTARSVPVRAEMVPGLGLGRVADMVPGIGCPGPGMGGFGDPCPVCICTRGEIRRMSKVRLKSNGYWDPAPVCKGPFKGLPVEPLCGLNNQGNSISESSCYDQI